MNNFGDFYKSSAFTSVRQASAVIEPIMTLIGGASFVYSILTRKDREAKEQANLEETVKIEVAKYTSGLIEAAVNQQTTEVIVDAVNKYTDDKISANVKQAVKEEFTTELNEKINKSVEDTVTKQLALFIGEANRRNAKK